MNKKMMTLCCVYNGTHMLLGKIKKEGPLKGRYNGFGGKVEDGEMIEQAAIRELKEECNITPLEMQKRGVVVFEFEPDGNPFKGKPEVELHIYAVTAFDGVPSETIEMVPQWFEYDQIPYGLMWPDDQHWIPMLLEGKNFEGTFHFKNPDTITNFELKEVAIVE